jgi:hypothetical protein
MAAKLDGEPQINVALTIDAPSELLALLRSEVATQSRQASWTKPWKF